jgi:lipopolysaccharide assembly outer membrane protein LptD (OstA)
MAAKSAISGEYIIQKEDSGSIVVYRIYDNTKGALREVAEEKNFQYDPNWTTRQFGNKVCKEFGDGKEAIVGCYNIRVQESGSIEVFRTYDNTKAALREIAGNVGFEFDPNWNTQQFGSKLIDFVNSK